MPLPPPALLVSPTPSFVKEFNPAPGCVVWIDTPNTSCLLCMAHRHGPDASFGRAGSRPIRTGG